MNETVNIKRLEPGDADTAVAVVKQFAGKEVATDYLRTFLTNPLNLLIVAEIEGHLAGFLLAHALPRLKQESYKMFIYEIDVAEAYRRRKVGTALINYIRDFVKRERMMNAFVFTSYSNAGAVEFYRNTGGKIVNGDDLMFVYDEENQV